MRRVRLFLAFSSILPAAHAQSVDSLVREALENNPQSRAFTHQREASEYRAAASGALPAPTIGLEFSQVPTSSADVANGAVSNNLSFSQMFMLGGKLSAMSEVDRRRGFVIDQNKASFDVQLRARVKMDYYRLWLLDRQIGVQRRTLALLSDLIQSTQPQVLTNRARQADLLSLQAEEASEQARLNDRSSRRNSLISGLNALLGRSDLSTPIRTDSLLPPILLRPSEADLAGRVGATNPDLAAMDRMKEMNEAMISSARKELIPDLMIQGMIMRMPNGMVLTGGSRSVDALRQSLAGMPMQKTEWMYSLMVSFTLPFMPWSSERSTARAEEMRSANLSIDAQREAMQRDMLASVRSAVITYAAKDSLARRYDLEVLPLMRRSAEAQTIAYRNGQVPIASVLDARRMELMKQDEYFMALMERQMAFVEMEMMVGSPLADNY